MTWKKYFKPANVSNSNSGQAKFSGSQSLENTRGWLPEYYSGSQDRIVRYAQYDSMDLDHEINLALNTIAEFCTQFSDDLKLPFKVEWNEEPVESEVEILKKILRQWSEKNEWRKRAFTLVRNTLKYGDQVFIRDPETFELHWVDISSVKYVIVNEADYKNIEYYAIADVSINLAENVATDIDPSVQNSNNLVVQHWNKPTQTSTNSSDRAQDVEKISYIPAKDVIHISMQDGMTNTWPFGISELEKVFKVFKQKELLEDSILIYRVHRAPERRAFFIDTGDLPPHRAKAHLEQFKLEVQQKRIPNKTGQEQNIMDSAYNPMSMIEDYFFAQSRDGRGSRVETLQGGAGLGEIDDLRYFNNKMIRGLSIPSAYLPTGPEDGTAPYTDGRVGTAFIQEYRFDRYCQRIQQILIDEIDHEFKMFMKFSGVDIDITTFRLEFCQPQNFSNYREIEMNTQFASSYAQVSDYPHISKRMAMKKYLGWDDNDILENEKMWKEEHGIENNEGDTLAKINDTRIVGLTASSVKQYINNKQNSNVSESADAALAKVLMEKIESLEEELRNNEKQ